MVGELLAKLDELGIADDTIVMYSTDNGAEMIELARRRHDAVPRREEHQLGRRLPRAVADPLAGRDQARHDHQRDRSRTRTCCRRCWRRPASRTSWTSCCTGKQVGDKTYKVHLDGYNLLPVPQGREPPKRRARSSSTGPTTASLAALRYDQWKLDLPRAARPRLRRLGGAVRRAAPAQAVHPARRPVRARRPRGHRLPALADRPRLHAGAGPGLRRASGCRASREFPPRMKAGSFGIDQVMRKMTERPPAPINRLYRTATLSARREGSGIGNTAPRFVRQLSR